MDTTRQLKVISQTTNNYQTKCPAIRLQGKWLEELQFAIGDYVQVECDNNRLIITKISDIAE